MCNSTLSYRKSCRKPGGVSGGRTDWKWVEIQSPKAAISSGTGVIVKEKGEGGLLAGGAREGGES